MTILGTDLDKGEGRTYIYCDFLYAQIVYPLWGVRKPRRKEEGYTMKIVPLQDRLLVRRLEEEEKTKGGIIIPDTAKEKPVEGKVIAVGKGRVKEDGTVNPLEVKAGDKILFSKYAGTEINIDGEEHLMMREDDILGIIKD
jgi:chaperonin GroES